MKSSDLRLLIAVALLLGTAWLLHARESFEIIPPHKPISTFPAEIGAWKGEDLTIDDETRQVLGHGEFLLRRYRESDSDPYIDLFIGYFPTQRTGDTMHSPQNCLPGSGWSPIQKNLVKLKAPDGSSFPANEYHVARGPEHQLVLYWYLAQGRAIASEYDSKIALVLDSMRNNRSDGALIRFSSPMFDGETQEQAKQRLLPFVNAALPEIYDYIPR